MSTAEGFAIPDFNDLGVLPVGRHRCRPDDLRRVLVTPFFGSNRQVIYEEWRSHRAALRTIGSVLFQWIGGTFVTNKTNPGDIDVVTFVDGVAYDRLPRWKRDVLEELCNGKGDKSYSRVDAALAFMYPTGDRRHSMYLEDREYWDGKWGRSRTSVVKGYLEVR